MFSFGGHRTALLRQTMASPSSMSEHGASSSIVLERSSSRRRSLEATVPSAVAIQLWTSQSCIATKHTTPPYALSKMSCFSFSASVHSSVCANRSRCATTCGSLRSAINAGVLIAHGSSECEATRVCHSSLVNAISESRFVTLRCVYRSASKPTKSTASRMRAANASCNACGSCVLCLTVTAATRFSTAAITS